MSQKTSRSKKESKRIKEDRWISLLAITLIIIGFIAVVVLALHALGLF
jgi:hypothetical protein